MEHSTTLSRRKVDDFTNYEEAALFHGIITQVITVEPAHECYETAKLFTRVALNY